jgi:hypothetical protein
VDCSRPDHIQNIYNVDNLYLKDKYLYHTSKNKPARVLYLVLDDAGGHGT